MFLASWWPAPGFGRLSAFCILHSSRGGFGVAIGCPRVTMSCAQAQVREYVPTMRITSHLFDAFLKCATKCHLRSIGEIGSGNEYAEWVRARDESYQREAARRLRSEEHTSELQSLRHL